MTIRWTFVFDKDQSVTDIVQDEKEDRKICDRITSNMKGLMVFKGAKELVYVHLPHVKFMIRSFEESKDDNKYK